ncbi:MAG: cell division protein FtsZ [Burkholderiales bacterium]|nr:cell division protein FtsZ [Burkholderiales bacterium]MDE2565670.1 cell division protein FtsZ [Burkholderiales bacterium]
MSLSLTLALAGLGLLVLAALALQGWWSTRRARPRRGSALAPVPDRQEPALGGETLPGPAAESGALPEPGLPRTAMRRLPRLDALIDALVPLALEAPISGDLALAHLPPTRRAGSKPFYIEGLDAETGQWEPLAPGRRYGELQAGVQLASRSGPLNEIEYSEFVHKVQAFADAVGASADPPDMLDVVARARELDGLTSGLDMQLAITLRSRGVAWSLGYLQQVAARLGFVPGAVPGRLVLPGPDEGAPPMLVLGVDPQAALAEEPQAAAVRDCALELDVPQTPAAAEPFPAWHRAATELAAELDADVIDGAGVAVTLHAYAGIGQELQGIYAQLETLGLPAGSPAARRLFS